MTLGRVAGLLIIAWLGYMIVSYFLNHFPSRNAPTPQPGPRAAPEPEDTPARSTADREPVSSTWFRTLEVRESAALDEISLAYRRKITQYHPDKVAQLGPELRDLAETKSKQLNEAYAFAKKLRQ